VCLFTFPLLICRVLDLSPTLRSDRRYLVKEKRVNHECP